MSRCLSSYFVSLTAASGWFWVVGTVLTQRPCAELPSKPLAVLPAFPSAVTAVAFSERAATGAAAGATPSGCGASMEDTEGLGFDEERTRCCLAVGLESGALEVWALTLDGARDAAASVSGNRANKDLQY